MGEIIARNM